MSRNPRKVFGIGLHKTGTSTLAECLRRLGYDLCPEEIGYQMRQTVAARDYLPMLVMADRYDAFEDSPWNYFGMHRLLDVAFPESKFILTTRDDEGWARSVVRWADRHESWDDLSWYQTFGCSARRELIEAMIIGKRCYEHQVRSYFGPRLLEVDWSRCGWPELCAFLDKPVPDATFPWMLRWDVVTDRYVDEPSVDVEELTLDAGGGEESQTMGREQTGGGT